MPLVVEMHYVEQGALGRNDMPSFDTNETVPILYARMPIRNENGVERVGKRRS